MKVIILPILLILSTFSIYGNPTIAVLPYKISYEGRIPKKFTPEDLMKAKEMESRYYQNSMTNYLVKMNSKRRNLKINIKILSIQQVDALLKEKKLTYKHLDSLTNEQLTEILGVTHVVRGAANRTFIMSDELSLGITAVSILTNGAIPMFNATSSINIINSLENTQIGTLVWSKQFIRNSSATYSDEQSLRDTFRYSSRKMIKMYRRGRV
ncbi:MAG: hypothetical protein Q8K70_02840 [Bacteroidota bacterium]|nr:hypothetical protein [Bacteroidota bacterium]